MDTDWCLVCDKHTDGGAYCSETCRRRDGSFPELPFYGHGRSSSSSPPPAQLARNRSTSPTSGSSGGGSGGSRSSSSTGGLNAAAPTLGHHSGLRPSASRSRTLSPFNTSPPGVSSGSGSGASSKANDRGLEPLFGSPKGLSKYQFASAGFGVRMDLTAAAFGDR